MAGNRIVILVVSLVTCLALQSCRDRRASSPASDANALTIAPGAGMGPVRFGAPKETVIAALGKPESTDAGGLALMYPSRGFTVCVHPRAGFFSVSCYTRKAAPPDLLVCDFAGKTSAGIGMGASRSQIIAAYGKADNETSTSGQVELYYATTGMRFVLLNDQLIQLMMERPPKPK